MKTLGAPTLISKGISYPQYRELVETLTEQRRTTGPEQSENHITLTQLNAHRMDRVYKTMVPEPGLVDALKGLKNNWRWVILAESWCGDGAQVVPAVAKMAEWSSGKITVEILMRDENPEIMDEFLTNGARSIPIVICVDAASGEILGHWGPRPKPATELMAELKTRTDITPEDRSVHIQQWYNHDRTKTIQHEFAALIKQWANN